MSYAALSFPAKYDHAFIYRMRASFSPPFSYRGSRARASIYFQAPRHDAAACRRRATIKVRSLSHGHGIRFSFYDGRPTPRPNSAPRSRLLAALDFGAQRRAKRGHFTLRASSGRRSLGTVTIAVRDAFPAGPADDTIADDVARLDGMYVTLSSLDRASTFHCDIYYRAPGRAFRPPSPQGLLFLGQWSLALKH